MYSAFRVRLLSQAQALPSLVLSRPFSHAGVYVHFLRFIWLFTCWFSSTLILKVNLLVFYFYAKKRCQWIFSTNTIYCRATLGGFFFGSRINSSFQYVLYNIVIKTTLIFLFHTDGLNQMHHEVHLMPS